MISFRLFLGGSEHRTAMYIEVHEDSSTRPTTKLSKSSIFFTASKGDYWFKVVFYG
jgi:hypothetical protein